MTNYNEATTTQGHKVLTGCPQGTVWLEL